MTKSEFWQLIVTNMGDCVLCPYAGNGICEEYIESQTSDIAVAPCMDSDVFGLIYEMEMEDDVE